MPSGGKHAQMKSFSASEDALLNTLVAEEGPRWKAIAEAMTARAPDCPRTPAMVRNRFLRVQKGKREAEEGKARNKCGLCGQLKKGHVCTADKAFVAGTSDEQGADSRALTLTPATSAANDSLLPPIAESRLDEIVAPQQQDENSVDNITSSTLQLFAPPPGLISGCDRTSAAAELQLAAACWSPQTSPGGGVEPSPDITMASLLAPTPEGFVYQFPSLPASLQAALSGAQMPTAV